MTAKLKNSSNQSKIIIGVVAAALVVAAIFIFVSSQSSLGTADINYADIPQARLDDGGFVLGNPDAPITIVAFEDFLCSHCQNYEPVLSQFVQQFVVPGFAKFEYRAFPAVHPTYSPLTAKLAECADMLESGSFWKAHDVLFEIASSSTFTDSSPRTFADRMGLSYAQLLDCTTDANQVDADTQLGTSLGVTGTPTIMVRYGNSTPQLSQYGQRPAFEELAILVETAG
jgi:protein-disulfide isomerase